MNLKELGVYKNKAIHEIILNTEITNIILPNQEYDIETLLKNNIFPYEYIPNIEEDQRTYICMETVVPRFKTNSCTDIQIALYIFTHKDLMKYESQTDVGTRVDVLCYKLDEIFNGNNNFGIGGLQQISVLPYKSIAKDYYGKVIIYSVSEFNKNRNLKK